jgi:hypothetical protein
MERSDSRRKNEEIEVVEEKAKKTEEISVVLSVIIIIVVAVAVYFATLAFSASQIDGLRAGLSQLQAKYLQVSSNYTILSGKYNTLLNSTYQKLVTSRNVSITPLAIYYNKKIILQSLLYPGYLNQPYNVSNVGYFMPSNTYIYYRAYTYPPYGPLQYINASYSRFMFNVTSQSLGYLSLKYASNSRSGLQIVSYNCAATPQYYYAAENASSNGSITIPISQGKNCLYIQNPSNSSIGLTFTATLMQFK